MTLGFKNTFIPDSGFFNHSALKLRFDFAIRLERLVSLVAL